MVSFLHKSRTSTASLSSTIESALTSYVFLPSTFSLVGLSSVFTCSIVGIIEKDHLVIPDSYSFVSGTFRNVVDVAVKSLKVGAMTNQQFLEEAECMHKLRHPKLVQLMGVCTAGQPLWIITERMAHGALIDYLRKDMGKTIQFATLIDMAAQVRSGLVSFATDGEEYLGEDGRTECRMNERMND